MASRRVEDRQRKSDARLLERNSRSQRAEVDQQQPRATISSVDSSPIQDPALPKMTDSNSLPGPSPSSTEPQAYSLSTNCLPIGGNGPIWEYSIVCEPKDFLSKKEKQLLEKMFQDHFKLGSIAGQLASVDGHTFLSSTKQGSLDRQLYVATIIRRPHKLDDSWTKTFRTDKEDKIVTWWSFVAGSKVLECDEIPKCPEPNAADRNLNCQVQTVYVYAKEKELNFETILRSESSDSLARYLRDVGSIFLPQQAVPKQSSGVSVVVHGNKLFSEPSVPLGLGLEVRKGVTTEVRLKDSGLLRTVLPCSKIFFKPMLLSDFIETHFAKSVISSKEFSDTLEKVVKGLNIRILGPEGNSFADALSSPQTNTSGKAAERLRTPAIYKVSGTNTVTTYFRMRDSCECETNVADYFTSSKSHFVLLSTR